MDTCDSQLPRGVKLCLIIAQTSLRFELSTSLNINVYIFEWKFVFIKGGRISIIIKMVQKSLVLQVTVSLSQSLVNTL